jgi:putative ABC transport system permease protein
MRFVTGTEIRNAVRSLSRSPTVTICAVLCLALGIGATTAISSALSRALLQPLPFQDPSRLVSVHRTTPQSGPQGQWPHSAPNYVDLRERSKQIQGLAAITWGTAIINLPGEPIQASQHYTTGNLFQTLGVRPQHGRFYTMEDDRIGQPYVAVMSDEMWRTRFGAEPSMVGRVLTIDGEPTTIIGITPPDFRVPVGANVLRVDLWMPIRFSEGRLRNRGNNYLLALGRLAPGATIASAEAELREVFAGMVREHPQLEGTNVRVAGLQAENLKTLRKPLLLLFGAVCMVLLIAATNVAALLLARGVQKQRDAVGHGAPGADRELHHHGAERARRGRDRGGRSEDDRAARRRATAAARRADARLEGARLRAGHIHCRGARVRRRTSVAQ